MSRLLGVVVVLLALLGAWAHGVASGYVEGTRRATATLRPRGMVVLTGPGQCDVIPEGMPGGLDPSKSYRTHFVTLLYPDGG